MAEEEDEERIREDAGDLPEAVAGDLDGERNPSGDPGEECQSDAEFGQANGELGEAREPVIRRRIGTLFLSHFVRKRER